MAIFCNSAFIMSNNLSKDLCDKKAFVSSANSINFNLRRSLLGRFGIIEIALVQVLNLGAPHKLHLKH